MEAGVIASVLVLTKYQLYTKHESHSLCSIAFIPIPVIIPLLIFLRTSDLRSISTSSTSKYIQ